MIQMRGVVSFVKNKTGLAELSEIFRLCLSPIVMGMISANAMTANVRAPERMPTQKLSNSLIASKVTSVV